MQGAAGPGAAPCVGVYARPPPDGVTTAPSPTGCDRRACTLPVATTPTGAAGLPPPCLQPSPPLAPLLTLPRRRCPISRSRAAASPTSAPRSGAPPADAREPARRPMAAPRLRTPARAACFEVTFTGTKAQRQGGVAGQVGGGGGGGQSRAPRPHLLPACAPSAAPHNRSTAASTPTTASPASPPAPTPWTSSAWSQASSRWVGWVGGVGGWVGGVVLHGAELAEGGWGG